MGANSFRKRGAQNFRDHLIAHAHAELAFDHFGWRFARSKTVYPGTPRHALQPRFNLFGDLLLRDFDLEATFEAAGLL